MKNAIINYISESRIDEYKDILESAGNIIKNGGTVIFPTETVYGLGANALDPRAAKRIFKAKGRPSDNPLIVHIANYEMLEQIAQDVSPQARKLMTQYWPGPLTMIFYKKKIVPEDTTGGLETVAVRMPGNQIALDLINEAGVPIAAPSANISGKPSITTGKYAIEEMAQKVDMIIIGEDSDIGIESTVVDMTTTIPVVLRPGKINQKEILKAISDSDAEFNQLLEQYEELRFSTKTNEAEPKSPGMKYTHYSPNARLLLLSAEEIQQQIQLLHQKGVDKASGAINSKVHAHLEEIENRTLSKIKVLTTDENAPKYGDYAVSLGSNGEEIGKNLFRVLRDLDEQKVELIFCENFAQVDHSEFLQAVMNRIKKAASNIED